MPTKSKKHNSFLLSDIPKQIDYSNYDVFIVQLKTTASIDKSFNCKVKEYTEYYKVHAFNDLQRGIGNTWVLTYKGKVLGFISIAMAHMQPERHHDLQGNGFGNIPSLLIGHLATHKDYENKGVGSHLVAWAIKKAREYSKTIGCKIVILNPDDKEEVREFYRKLGFTYVPHDDKGRDAFFLDIGSEKVKHIAKKV